MRRRDFFSLFGGVVAAWPLAARAQQPAMRTVGFLSGASGSDKEFEPMREYLAAFRQGLAETGFVENQNLAIEYRWAENDYGRLASLAADLVRREVSAIIVLGAGTPGAQAAQAATQTIPIVYQIGTDPVKVGLAASLARPGGNLTGVTLISVGLIAKCFSLMHELVPAATIAVLVNPANPSQIETETSEVQTAAAALGVRLLMLRASSADEIDAAFATLAGERAGGLVVSGEYLFATQDDRLVALAARYAVPTIYQYPHHITAGGLMSYAASLTDASRLVGLYTGRILKGEKPADLPVQQLTKINLTINLKTAKALGLAVPESLLARADEVIE